jgi:hypothetical protein
MSYDVYLLEDPCPTCGHTKGYDFNWNYTSNCSGMWREAGVDLASFDGRQVSACVVELAVAIQTLEREPERFIAMNPANGWGSYESLVPALKQLLRAFEEHLTAKVEVSR